MNLLSRVQHPRLLHPRDLTRTSSTPQTPHATPTAAFSSGRPTPYKSRPTSCSSPRGAYIRYLTTPLLSPNTSTTSIFASSNRLLPHKATTSQMSSSSASASTPASTQLFASSTPSQAPPTGSNQSTDADASHPHPFGRPRGDDDLDPGNSNNLASMENSSSAQDPAASGDNNDNGVGGGGSLPALPAPNHANSSDGSATTTTLEVDGKAVVLDHLGPMVIGRDGTVSRISNWQEMSERERQNTLRILGKRNQVRLAALRGGGEADSKAA